MKHIQLRIVVVKYVFHYKLKYHLDHLRDKLRKSLLLDQFNTQM